MSNTVKGTQAERSAEEANALAASFVSGPPKPIMSETARNLITVAESAADAVLVQRSIKQLQKFRNCGYSIVDAWFTAREAKKQ